MNADVDALLRWQNRKITVEPGAQCARCHARWWTLVLQMLQRSPGRCVCSDKPRCDIDDYVVIGVSGIGTGMASGTLEYAFEPLFMTKEDGAGNGLSCPWCAGSHNSCADT